MLDKLSYVGSTLFLSLNLLLSVIIINLLLFSLFVEEHIDCIPSCWTVPVWLDKTVEISLKATFLASVLIFVTGAILTAFNSSWLDKKTDNRKLLKITSRILYLQLIFGLLVFIFYSMST